MNFETLFSTTVIKNIKSNGGEVYAVGGCVRDFYLNRKSKDIDVIVRLLPFDKLNPILLKTGKCDLVGQSFGVIKYIDNSGFELDIALPRTDKKGEGDKHQDIETQSDPFMPLEKDLKRRDFTFNAMAIDMNLNLIDPFEGLKDLKNGVVKCVDDKAFVDDPLRIMRGLRFAAQLGFRIEKKTHGLIKIHKSKLNNISPERKHDELVKIANSKRNSEFLYRIFKSSHTIKNIFGVEFKNFTPKINITSLPEMLSMIVSDFFSSIDHKIDFFKKNLKISVDEQNQLKALCFYKKRFPIVIGIKEHNRLLFDCLNIAKNTDILNSELIPEDIKINFQNGVFPIHKHQIALTGEDLMEFGYFGKDIANMHEKLLEQIFSLKVLNNKWELTKFVYNKMPE